MSLNIDNFYCLMEKKLLITKKTQKNKLFRSFSMQINNTPKESDFVNIKVVDCRFREESSFEVKVDLYGDIFEQIFKIKNIVKTNIYFIYKTFFSNYENEY